VIVRVKGGRWERWRMMGSCSDELLLLSPPAAADIEDVEFLGRRSTLVPPPSASSIPSTILSSAVNELELDELGRSSSSTNENETSSEP